VPAPENDWTRERREAAERLLRLGEEFAREARSAGLTPEEIEIRSWIVKRHFRRDEVHRETFVGWVVHPYSLGTYQQIEPPDPELTKFNTGTYGYAGRQTGAAVGTNGRAVILHANEHGQLELRGVTPDTTARLDVDNVVETMAELLVSATDHGVDR
jgi:hypothetical protein